LATTVGLVTGILSPDTLLRRTSAEERVVTAAMKAIAAREDVAESEHLMMASLLEQSIDDYLKELCDKWTVFVPLTSNIYVFHRIRHS
jgi:hypothetical protein